MRTGGGRTALTLVPVARSLRTAGVDRRGAETEEAQSSELHAGPQCDRKGRDIGQLQSDVSAELGIDEAGGRVREQAEPTQRGLAIEAGGYVIGQGHELVAGGEDELAGVEDER